MKLKILFSLIKVKTIWVAFINEVSSNWQITIISDIF